MSSGRHKGYNVYKGLQKPLVFKNFKGRFIYWAMGSAMGGFASALLVSVVFNFMAGFITLIAVSMSGLLYTNFRQKKGLHAKTKSVGVYIIPSRLSRRQ
ncbi:DUF4133 domain-containing protein [Pontibacter diazotrophicus]|uniref:DUF4133 domain-containing protein n=1 Tax=Pontibacter diazotrophicus TaxID=1400979 RepID=A0A3D8L3G4_9BACT|nr:DUF4133 domain-containing protein [Pontibacter diazotrophicus]RDV11885.1 DUF4133 domain-containing protein [Pontibacter diazotrophicus]